MPWVSNCQFSSYNSLSEEKFLHSEINWRSVILEGGKNSQMMQNRTMTGFFGVSGIFFELANFRENLRSWISYLGYEHCILSVCPHTSVILLLLNLSLIQTKIQFIYSMSMSISFFQTLLSTLDHNFGNLPIKRMISQVFMKKNMGVIFCFVLSPLSLLS